MGFFERLYHIIVAVTALGVLLVIVFGTMFLLLGGLVESLWSYDLFALAGRAWQASVAFLAEALEGLPAALDRLWGSLLELLDRGEPAPPEPPSDQG